MSAAVTGRRRVKTDGQLYVKFWANDSTRPGGFDGAQPADGWRGWRTARYTYAVRCVGGKQVDEYLFDRKTDPQQLQNLAATHPRVVQKMRAALRSRLLEIGDPAADNLNDK